MPKVEIYTADYCPYCTKAKNLMQQLGIEYTEIDLSGDQEARIALVQKAEGRKTIPQIFVDDKPMGGYDDLVARQESGELQAYLA